ncbi:Choline trimethylamine-lyase [bioreactor metagenome]|uniref:Choline trimethylamine-lyase n=1 Tax=bioreactor metagenome TaxID=1076179 RepID=A0A645I8V2_9ZZZZ
MQRPEHKDARGGQYCLSNLSETLHVTHGHNTIASPDGRLAFTPLSDNASPAMGRDMEGPTATMNSVAKMDQVHGWDGTLYNIRFDPKSVSGKKGQGIMRSMIKAFVKNGGEHVQINVVDNNTLLAAQEHPEDYRSLVVRIAGYMAYFTELDKECQDNLIYRTTHQI